MNTVTIQEQRLNGSLPHSVASVNSKLTSAFIICFLSMLFSGITSMLMSVYLPVVIKDLLQNVSDEKMNTISAYINAVFLFGSMFGGFTWGVICDQIGRSRAVILSTALYGLFTLLTAFSSSWLLTGIYRFFTGFGVGGILVTVNILIAELWSEKRRAVIIGIVSSGMPVGFIAAGAMNNLLPDWHHAFLAGIIPVIVAIIGVFTLAESESWKTNKQTPADSNPLYNQLFAPAYKSNLLRGSIIFGAMLIGLWAVFSWAPTWIQSITGNDAKAQSLRGITMMLLAVSGLTGSVVSGWIANAIGLRKTMMLCFAACFIMTVVVFELNTSVTNFTFIEMGILGFFFGISQGALSVFIPLLFPTIIRASATGFCFNIGRIFTATVVFFIGALVSLLGGYGNAIVTFSFIFIIGLIFTYFSKDDTEAAANRDELLTAFAD
jgi:MFS family permease